MLPAIVSVRRRLVYGAPASWHAAVMFSRGQTERGTNDSFYSAFAGTNTSRLPLVCIAETMPARSMSSIRRAARL